MMGSSSTSFCLGMSTPHWAFSPSEISLVVTAPNSRPPLPPFAVSFTWHSFSFSAVGLRFGLLAGLFGPSGLLLQVHGIDGVRRGGNRQLPGQEEIAGVSLGYLYQLALFALASHILL